MFPPQHLNFTNPGSLTALLERAGFAVDEVTTPGGTAIAAVAELEHHGLRTMLINAVATATKRSAELSELNKS